MPWRETCPMDERAQFVRAYLAASQSMVDLCRDYGISRKTGYKWIQRFTEGGEAGLIDRSRAPHHHPNAVSREMVKRIVRLRRSRRWCASKLVAYLRSNEPEQCWPAPSTVTEILKREGLIEPRAKRVRRAEPYTEPFVKCAGANVLWGADYKGQFKLSNGQWCFPLTVTDSYSRYLLGCKALPDVAQRGAQPVFERLFRRYGLPQVIRTDNGPPFATNGLASLSKLGVRWLKLGIRHERIRPGHPEQNGRHERMHRSMKREVLHVTRANFQAQQRAFDRWRRIFNEERPHDALGEQPPESCYEPSPRTYPRHLPEVEYPDHYLRRQVRQNGSIKWHSKLLYISEALVHEPVGLEKVDEGRWLVYFGPMKIGILDESLMKVLPVTSV